MARGYEAEFPLIGVPEFARPPLFSRNTRNQLKQVFDALRELMTPPDPPKRPIGVITSDDKGKKVRAKGKA